MSRLILSFLVHRQSTVAQLLVWLSVVLVNNYAYRKAINYRHLVSLSQHFSHEITSRLSHIDRDKCGQLGSALSCYTVKSPKFEVLRTRGFVLNYQYP